ncbi:MAG: DNA-3-methyladenine glycosylase I [Candidatus Eremiobacteraeota bacterium]|nr:DNA-3-methyladenine glycosylase I [Candidatus Eremiobacteraeota bacterium]
MVRTGSRDVVRCAWAAGPLTIPYHDEEWGVPQHDDRALFELLVLEGAQAGLSWVTILAKRERYRKVFSKFEPRLVARYDAKKVRSLLADPGIVRNRLKIAAAIENARRFLAIQGEFGSFDTYLWNFVDGVPIDGKRKRLGGIPPQTALSDRVSADLRKRGFRFVGSTIVYSFLQATGVVNDHVLECFRYREVKRLAKK